MIQNILKEIKTAMEVNPKVLFAKLIQERLQLALVNYYADLNSKYELIENQAENNSIRVMKKLIK